MRQAAGSLYQALKKRLEELGDPRLIDEALRGSDFVNERIKRLSELMHAIIMTTRDGSQRSLWAMGYIARIVDEIEEWRSPGALVRRVDEMRRTLSKLDDAVYNE